MFSSISRRQILSLIGFLGIGTVAGGSVPFISNFLASKAQAQEISQEVYKGRRFRIVTNQSLPRNATIDRTRQLFIDDKEVMVMRDNKTQKYMTPLLFGEYNSPQEVAKILIDLGIKIPSSEVQLDPNVD